MSVLTRALLALLSLIVAGSAPAKESPEPATGIAFVRVAVIPMDRDHVLRNQTVLVRDERIERLGPSARVKIPRGYKQIDGRGKYLMPGLADFHIHLRSPGEFINYLGHGVTTVAQLSGTYPTAPDILGYKRLIAAGVLIGPTIYASGPLVDNAPLLPHTRAIGVGVSTPDEARKVVGEQRAAGYDMIKIYQMLKPDVYDALVHAALDQGIAPIGHVPQTIDVEHAMAAGQQLIAHGSFFLEPLLNADASAYDLSKLGPIIAQVAKSGTAVTPTIMTEAAAQHLESPGVYEAVFNDPEMKYLAPSLREVWRRTDPAVLKRYGRSRSLTVPFHFQLTKALSDAGALLVLGTDEGAVPGLFPGRSVHEELEAFVAAGLTPFQALSAATRNPGRFVQMRIDPSDSFGIIVEGARADLLLLDRNPLVDVRAARQPLGVMARGRWLEASALRDLRQAIAREFRFDQ
jgi:imidazolonepropionase-like amidohydrolase